MTSSSGTPPSHILSYHGFSDRNTSAISAAIGVMLRELESAMEPHLNTLSRTPWTTVKLVSGQSAYVQDMLNVIEQIAETVKPLVEQKKYLRNYFDKASR